MGGGYWSRRSEKRSEAKRAEYRERDEYASRVRDVREADVVVEIDLGKGDDHRGRDEHL